MPWWLQNNLRMIQNNLRDMDAEMDVDALVEELQSFHANAVMVGAAGISAFYPTKQPFQTPSPFLKSDKLGEIVDKCHAKGIRVIARFDFSKTHESLYEEHPQWYYRDLQGQAVRYNDTVQTCINGPYQQELSLEMIREVITNYPVDGIFFNMFGYFTRDYSNVYHGICQCEACRRRFRAYSGLELPTAENDEDPAFVRYKAFKEFTVCEMLERIHALARALNPEVAICTYHPYCVDMVRSESNSAVDRPLPFWLYSASENCQIIEDSWEDKLASNCVINAVDIFYRFQGVSKHLTEMRLLQNMAAGSILDYCIIGVFADYPDRAAFDLARGVFAFHAKHERYYGHMQSEARLLLIKPGRTQRSQREYRGLYRMLKEAHIPFDVAALENLGALSVRFDRYAVILLPDLRIEDAAVADALCRTRANLLATGRPFADTQEGRALRQAVFGVVSEEAPPDTRSWYCRTEPKAVFGHFPDRAWVFLDAPLSYLETEPDNENLLPMVAPAMYGPPERCYGHRLTEHPAATIKTANGRRAALLAFAAGTLYEKYGYEDHKELLLDVLSHLGGLESAMEVDAPPCVEVFFNRIDPKHRMLQLLNLSGFNGTTFSKPVPVPGVSVTIKGAPPKSIRRLTPDGEETVAPGAWIDVGTLERYEAYVLEDA